MDELPVELRRQCTPDIMGNVLESVRERATHSITHVERTEKVHGNRLGRHAVIIHEQNYWRGKEGEIVPEKQGEDTGFSVNPGTALRISQSLLLIS